MSKISPSALTTSWNDPELQSLCDELVSMQQETAEASANLTTRIIAQARRYHDELQQNIMALEERQAEEDGSERRSVSSEIEEKSAELDRLVNDVIYYQRTA